VQFTELVLIIWSCVKFEDKLFLKKSIEYVKSAKGRSPWYTGSIQRGLGGRGEEREKIRKTNHLRGQPPRNPSEESK
jgi:hypothetical protein